jgi:hypothetical protein
MRRKVPDTWWGAVVVGVLAGGVGGATWAAMTAAMEGGRQWWPATVRKIAMSV